MSGQMCWLFRGENKTERILYLREYPSQSWKPYTAYSQYCVPDYRIPGGTKGWATYQKLCKSGWTLIASNSAHVSPVLASVNSQK